MPVCKIYTGRTVLEITGYLEEYPEIFIVADRNVAHYAGRLAKELSVIRGESFSDRILLLEATERNKTMDTVLDICGWLLEKGADRKALVLAMGGGITTDMAGFAASIYKRGIRSAYVPTTLLAQADAAIGGKTGVNFGNYKNMLGIIRQPEFTFICPEVLGTLPYRDLLSGAAEMLKTFIIDNSGDNYRRALEILSEIHRSPDREKAIGDRLSEIRDLAGAAAGIKAGVVERDEFEQDERRKLNLGHTFAHAIEHEARERGANISHGEAVAMGIVMAAKVSEKYFGGDSEDHPRTKPDLFETISNDFLACGLPVNCPFPVSSLVESMGKDKKAEDGHVNFVLIRAIGDVRIVPLNVDEALNYL